MWRGMAVLLVAIVVLAGCGSVQPPQGSAERATLTFLIAGDPTDETAYQQLIDAFEAAHPEIGVNLLNIPSHGDFRKRLTADFAAGTPPDLFLVNYRRYGPYVARDAIEFLDPYLAESDLIDLDDYYPQALAAFRWEGKLACMPQNLSSPVLYYNKDLFDAAGVDYPRDDWTWNDFAAVAAAVSQDSDGDGVTDIYGLGMEASIVRLAPFLWMNGGDIVDNPAAPTTLTLDSAESREALAWFVALQTEHRVVPDAVAEEAESSLSRFVNGRLAMIMESRRATPEFRLISSFDWDVAGLPQGKQRASVLHADAYCIAAAGRHKDAAWTFVEFANTREGQTILARTGRTVPSLIELAESSIFLDPEAKPANSQAFLDAIPHLRNLPVMSTWSDIEGILNTEITNAFTGASTVDGAINAAERNSAEFFTADD
ncbi:extracellular solute-binding protein [bacterium]|nr:extracellular solute-binding protein [bacterium]